MGDLWTFRSCWMQLPWSLVTGQAGWALGGPEMSHSSHNEWRYRKKSDLHIFPCEAFCLTPCIILKLYPYGPWYGCNCGTRRKNVKQSGDNAVGEVILLLVSAAQLTSHTQFLSQAFLHFAIMFLTLKLGGFSPKKNVPLENASLSWLCSYRFFFIT